MSIDPVTPVQSALNRLAAGDPSARDEVLRVARARVALVVQRMLRDFRRVRHWCDSDDVIQDAYIRLNKALATVTFSTSRQFFGLVAVVVRRCLIDISRRLFGPEGLVARYVTADGAAAAALEQAASPESDGPAGFTQWEQLHAAADALPHEEREVFMLLYYNGLSQKEAAAELGVCDRTVKRRWQKARALLGEALGLTPLP